MAGKETGGVMLPGSPCQSVGSDLHVISYPCRNRKELSHMLANCRIHSTLPATDLERARRFYAEKLGLTPVIEEPGGLSYRCGEGSLFWLYPSQGSASGTHTQAGWLTNHIEAERGDLKTRGGLFGEDETTALKA